MRDQYVGDISDVLKFAFLCSLTGNDRTLGIAWYYVPFDDGRPDGRHLEWKHEPAWRELDAPLHTGLSNLNGPLYSCIAERPHLAARYCVSSRGNAAPPRAGCLESAKA